MSTLTRFGLRAALAGLLALGGVWSTANAQLTQAGTQILNRATVSYSVGGVGQTDIESSPTGNSTPGANNGADTQFLVDQVVDLTVDEVSGNATTTSPGATAAVIAFTVQNDGNAPQGYQLTISEEVATSLFGNVDSFDIGLANLLVRVDEDPSGGDGTGNDAYDGTETATAIDVLNPGQQITVFVIANIPLSALNGAFANVNLLAQTAEPGTNGATLQTESPGVNDPTTVEVVFGDTDTSPNDGADDATDQYAIQSAALTVTKAATVLSDPFGSASPRAVPAAIVEYTVTVTNNGATPADAVGVEDVVPADTTFRTGLYAGSTDVEVTVGASPAAFCIADVGDANTDGCAFDGTTLTVGAPVLGSIAAASSATVRFRVEID
jgi:uncharacterized repeat protein (TIGR01451 family)